MRVGVRVRVCEIVRVRACVCARRRGRVGVQGLRTCGSAHNVYMRYSVLTASTSAGAYNCVQYLQFVAHRMSAKVSSVYQLQRLLSVLDSVPVVSMPSLPLTCGI